MNASQHASFGDYVLAGLLLAIILFVTARACLRAIGWRPPAKRRIYIEVPHAVEYIAISEDLAPAVEVDALQEHLLESEASLLPVVTPIYR